MSLNDLGLDLLMNKRKSAASSQDGGSQVSSMAPSIRSVKMTSVRPPAQDNVDRETVSIDYDDDLDSASEMGVPAPRRAAGFQSGFDGFRAKQTPVPSERMFPGIGRQPDAQYMSHQDDILDQKREILYQLDRLEKRGVKLPRKYTLASSLEEMQAELERLKRDRELDASVKFQKRMLMAAVTGMEFLNHRFDPFDVKLDGWSESMHDQLPDYDEVMEELAEKYRGKAKIAPEIKILMMVAGSGFMYHLQQRYFKSMPGLDQVFQQNPDLMRQFASATMNTVAGNSADHGASGFAAMMGNVFGAPPMSEPRQPQGAPAAAPAQRMRGPSDVDDLLRELQTAGISVEPTTTTSDPNVEIQSLADSDSDDASLEGLLRATGGL